MSDIVDIIISAVDQASDVFRDIVGSASDMGSEISSSVSEAGDSISDFTQFTDEEVAYMMGELDEMPTSFDEIGSAASDASTGIDEIGSSIDGLEASEFEEMAGEVQDFGDSVTGTTSQIQGLTDELDIVNAGMLMQTAEQVNNLAGNAEDMASSINEAAITVGQLSTATGIAEPQIVDLINNISNETFPQEEAMAYVEALHQMGVESSNFGSSATDMDRINDAFGIGYQNVIQLTRGMGVLGVDANNLSSSYNALAYVQSNVNGGVNTLNTVLGRQGATFQELGLNIDQVALIMDTASHKWTTARTLNSGLSSALKECGGDLRALEQELGMQEGALDNASAVTGEYSGKVQELAQEEMTHKTLLERLGAAWEDVSLSASNALAPLAGVIGFVGEVGGFGMQVQGIRNMGTAIKDTAQWVRELNIVQGVMNGILGISSTETAVLSAEEMALAATQAGLTAEEIGAAAAHAGNAGAITAEGVAATGASGGFWSLAAAVVAATWPILLAAAAVAAFVFAIYEVGKAFGWWTDVGSMIDAIWAGIQKLWDTFINHPDVQAVLGAISNALSTLWSWITQAGQAILEFFGVATGGDFDIVASIIQIIGGLWDNLKATIMTVVGVVTEVYNVITWAFNAIWSVVAPIVMQIVNLVIGLIGAFNSFKSGQLDLPGFIMTVLSMLANTYMSIFNYIIGLVANFGSRLLQRGISAATKFVKGIVSHVKQLPGKVYSALVAVVGRISSAIQSWINTAKSKVTTLISNITSPFRGVVSAIKSALSGVANAIMSPFKQAWDLVKPYIDQIKQGIDTIGNMLSFGGEAYGGETATDVTTGKSFDINNGQYVIEADNEPIVIEDNLNLTLDLINVPSNFSVDELVSMIQDRKVLQALTANRDFQDLDARVKQKLTLKGVRAKGR